MIRSRTLLLRYRTLVQRVYASTVPGSNAQVTIKGRPASEVYDEKSDKLQAIDIDDLPRAQKRFAVQFEKINEVHNFIWCFHIRLFFRNVSKRYSGRITK